MYAYYALHQFNRFPHEIQNLSRYEKAAVYAFIDERVKEEKKMKRKMPRKR